MIQVTYSAHLANLHLLYLLIILGTFTATTNSLITAEKKYIITYNVATVGCCLSLMLSPAQYSFIMSLGFTAGAGFTIATTFINKNIRDENLRIKVELDQAKKYAHEINSPLLIVKGRILQVLKKGKDLHEEDIKRLKKADEYVDKISEIVKLVG